MQEVWGRNGYKTSGTWAEVFGKDEWADEVFMAWHYARYLQKIISEGKAELNLPMYVNAWLGPQPGELVPGDWPSGGPVARVMDVWRAGAPAVDFIAPDIYVDDFKGTCALYARSGNPLFYPEAMDRVGNLVWSIGKYSAMGVSPFGIEDLAADGQVAQAYGLLSQMLPQLAEWQAAGKVAGVLLDGRRERNRIPGWLQNNRRAAYGSSRWATARHRNGARPWGSGAGRAASGYFGSRRNRPPCPIAGRRVINGPGTSGRHQALRPDHQHRAGRVPLIWVEYKPQLRSRVGIWQGPGRYQGRRPLRKRQMDSGSSSERR